MGVFDKTNDSNGHRYVVVQYRDAAGNWCGRSSTPAASEGGIRDLMQSLKRQNPDSQIRAIDEQTGAIVDFLP